MQQDWQQQLMTEKLKKTQRSPRQSLQRLEVKTQLSKINYTSTTKFKLNKLQIKF